MKDLIEERDKKDKMKHSIVKWWNVHYMTPEELTAEQAREDESDMRQASHAPYPEQTHAGNMSDSSAAENLHAAQEIIDRLNREAAEDEARKQQEIEQARLAAEANFNETTGSFSGTYGVNGVKEKHREQIDAILAEKDEALRDLIKRTGEE